MTAGLGFPSHVCLQHHMSSCHPLHHCKGTNAFPAKQGSDILFLSLSSAGQALGIGNKALRSIISNRQKAYPHNINIQKLKIAGTFNSTHTRNDPFWLAYNKLVKMAMFAERQCFHKYMLCVRKVNFSFLIRADLESSLHASVPYSLLLNLIHNRSLKSREAECQWSR